jgi:hypothetical protein
MQELKKYSRMCDMDFKRRIDKLEEAGGHIEEAID